MFYLIRPDGSIASAETFDRAAALVEKGWVLTTRERYMAWWKYHDALPMQQLIEAAARCAPLERTVGD